MYTTQSLLRGPFEGEAPKAAKPMSIIHLETEDQT